MSCVNTFVARKFHNPEVSPTTAQIAAINQRLTAIQLAGLHIPSRARKIQNVRRRLPVTMIPAHPFLVKMRHVHQDLGNAVSETQPVQNQRA